MLYRAEKAGVRNGVKAIFWYQGSADDAQWSSVIPNYLARFDTLYSAWKKDYPSLKKIYFYQNRPRLQITEAHRQIGEIYRDRDVTLFSTAANAPLQADGTHFTLDGYNKLADWAYPVVNRDIYNHPDSLPFITPPAIKRAFFTNNNKDEVALEFDQPVYWMNDTVVIAGTDTIHAFLKDYFAFDTSNGVVDTGYSLPSLNRVVLKLKQPSTATSISYIKHRYYLPWAHITPTGSYNKYTYQGPWLLNERRLGILVFTKFPLTLDTSSVKNEYKETYATFSMPRLSVRQVSDMLLFKVSIDGVYKGKLTLSSISGQKVNSLIHNSIGGAWQARLKIDNLSSGIYLANIELCNGLKMSQKVVITR